MDCLNSRSNGFLCRNEAGTASFAWRIPSMEEPRKEGAMVDTERSLMSLNVWSKRFERKGNFSIESSVIMLFLFRVYPVSANLTCDYREKKYPTWVTDTNEWQATLCSCGYEQIQKKLYQR